jgi:hypothetical protein
MRDIALSSKRNKLDWSSPGIMDGEITHIEAMENTKESGPKMRPFEMRVIDRDSFTLMFFKEDAYFMCVCRFVSDLSTLTTRSQHGFKHASVLMKTKAEDMLSIHSRREYKVLIESLNESIIENAVLRRVWSESRTQMQEPGWIFNYSVHMISREEDGGGVYYRVFKALSQKGGLVSPDENIILVVNFTNVVEALEYIYQQALEDNGKPNEVSKRLFEEMKKIDFSFENRGFCISMPMVRSPKYMGMELMVVTGRTICSVGHEMYCMGIQAGLESPIVVCMIQSEDDDPFLVLSVVLTYLSKARRAKAAMFVVSCAFCDNDRVKQVLKKVELRHIQGSLQSRAKTVFKTNVFSGEIEKIYTFQETHEKNDLIRNILDAAGI